LLTNYNKTMKYTAIIILFLVSNSVLGQNTHEIQTMLKGHLKKMAYYKYDSPNDDSVIIENAHFKRLLLKDLSENPSSTLASSFSMVVKEGLMIATSDDGLFRIYSWDTQTGGTMRFYDNVFQYSSGGKVYYKANDKDTSGIGDPLSWYSEIFTLEDGGKTYYLGVYNADYSNRDKAQGIKFFTIENGVLNTDVKLAKTKDGLSNDLGIGYDFFTVPDNSERPFKLVVYKANKKTITMPVVDENSKVTNKLTTYKFKNGYFEEVK
jgi:hypothetical protein